MHHRHIVILVANARRARVLRRDYETGHFEEWMHIEDGPASDRFGPGRSGVDERRRRQRLKAFVEVIATQLRAAPAKPPLAGVLIVAPARMLADLQAEIARHFPVVGKAALDVLAQSPEAIADLMQGRLLAAERLVEANAAPAT